MSNEARDLVRAAVDALDQADLQQITHEHLIATLQEINQKATNLSAAMQRANDDRTTGLVGAKR